MILTATILCVTPLIGATGPQESEPLRAVDAYVQAAMSRRSIPGLALAVVHGGKVKYTRGYGQANVEQPSPVEPTTVFQIASLTKHMTAALLLRLVERGSLDLDDSLGRLVSECPNAWREITVRQCLTHTSGLPDPFLRRLDGEIALRNYTTQIVLNDAARLPLEFPPGTGAAYSDLGYLMLGLVIEQITGKSWRDCMHDELFRPLGMDRASIRDLDAIVVDRAGNYRLEADQLRINRRDYDIEVPSFGGVMSSARDLALYDMALAEGRILSEASLQLMWTPARRTDGEPVVLWDQPYGLGWSLGEYRGRSIAEHDGWTGTSTLRFLEEELTVIVLTNLEKGSNSEPWRITRGVARFFLDDLIAVKEPTPAPDIERLVGVYEHENGVRQSVSLENGRLLMQSLWHAEGSHDWPLLATSPRSFEAIDEEASVFFELAAGQAQGFVLRVEGEDLRTHRLAAR